MKRFLCFLIFLLFSSAVWAVAVGDMWEGNPIVTAGPSVTHVITVGAPMWSYDNSLPDVTVTTVFHAFTVSTGRRYFFIDSQTFTGTSGPVHDNYIMDSSDNVLAVHQGTGMILGSTPVNQYLGVRTIQANIGYTIHKVLIPFESVDQPQTISANALSGSLVTGQSQSGVATGAQGGNLYRASVTSQTGGIVINPLTGAYVVSAGSSMGTVTFNIWADAGNGYALGNTVSGSYTVGASKKVTVTIPANSGKYPIVYVLSQGGLELGRYTQEPGANSKIQQIDVGANDGACTLTAIIQGVKMDGVSLVEDVNGVYESPEKTELIPTADPSAPPVVPVPPEAISSPQSKSSGVVWTAGDSSSVPASQVNLLTAQIYREGVEKLLAAGKVDPAAATGLQGNDIQFDSSASTAQGAAVLGVVGRLPQAPNFVTLGKTPLIACSFRVPTSITASQEFTVSFDASRYSAQIDVFRLIFRSAMVFGFFVLYTRTLRDAFA